MAVVHITEKTEPATLAEWLDELADRAAEMEKLIYSTRGTLHALTHLQGGDRADQGAAADLLDLLRGALANHDAREKHLNIDPVSDEVRAIAAWPEIHAIARGC